MTRAHFNMLQGQPWYVSHAETIAQNLIGQLCAFVILWMWGLPWASSLKLQLVFFVVAYTRGYLIRRWFNRCAAAHKEN